MCWVRSLDAFALSFGGFVAVSNFPVFKNYFQRCHRLPSCSIRFWPTQHFGVPHCQAGSCLAVWRAVCDLVGKAMDPQWSALAEGEPATDGPVTGSTGSTGSDTRMRGIRRRNHFKKVAEDMLHEGDSQLQNYLRHNLYN